MQFAAPCGPVLSFGPISVPTPPWQNPSEIAIQKLHYLNHATSRNGLPSADRSPARPAIKVFSSDSRIRAQSRIPDLPANSL